MVSQGAMWQMTGERQTCCAGRGYVGVFGGIKGVGEKREKEEEEEQTRTSLLLQKSSEKREIMSGQSWSLKGIFALILTIGLWTGQGTARVNPFR